MSGTVGNALRGTVSTIVGLALAGVMAWQSGSTPTAPVNTAPPAITGTPQVGQALTAFDGTFSGTAPITIARRWQYSADGSTGWTTISGATGATYTPAAARQGQYIRVQVQASNAAGSSAWISSAAVGPVAAAAGATGLLSGTTWPSQPQAQPANLIPENARLFATSAPYGTGFTGVTFGSTGAVFDGSNASSTVMTITLPTALVAGRRYGLLFGMPERTAGTVSVALMPGAVAPAGASFTAARNFTRYFTATQAHTSVRITVTGGSALRMNYIQLVDMTALLAKKQRVVFIFDAQSNIVGAESSDVDWSIDTPEPRALYIPGVANAPFGAVLDGNGVGMPLLVQDPLQHSTTNSGGGPMGSFVKRMCEWLADDEVLVLVAVGWAGQGRLNSGYWNRDGADYRAWTNMLTQLRGTMAQASTGSTVCGALQCGHEADISVNSATLLPAAVERDIADLRAEFGDFPVVMMEIGNATPNANQIAQQDAMEALAGRLARCAYIRRPAGATFRPDGVHYDQATNRIRGAAAADKLLEINYGAPKPSTGGGAIAGTLTNPATSMNLTWQPPYAMAHSPWLNWLKVGSDWENRAGLQSAGHINAKGAVVSLPSSGEVGAYIFRDMPAPAGGVVSGRFRLTWTGSGTISVFHAQNTTQVGPNEIRFDYTATGNSLVYLRVDSVTSGPLDNFALVHVDDIAAYDGGQRWRSSWLDIIRNQRILRFKDWQMIDNYTGPTAWANRTPAGSFSYQVPNGVPLEEMLDLCAVIGADPWFCMAHTWPASYQQSFATFVRDNLRSQSHVHTEFSNKIWDFNLSQASELRDEAMATSATFTDSDWPEWYGGRMAEMAQIWRSVWTGANAARLHTVFQCWTDNEGLDQAMLDAPKWRALTSAQRPGWPTGRALPSSYMTDYAVHGVLDGNLRYEDEAGNPNPTLAGWISSYTSGTRTLAQVHQLMAEQCTDLRHIPSSYGDGRTVVGERNRWIYHKGKADERGLKLIMYEGGTHLVTPPSRVNNATWNLVFNSFHMSQPWADTFDAVMTNWFTLTGDAVFNRMCDVLPQGPYHNEGLYRFIGDNNPQIPMWNAQMAAHTGPAGRGAGDFVGTYEATP
ncbi:hypothetical protein GL279_00405 [Paracoccus limosus]|uniref:Uncharacterized protein n=2 Tax=Paracoccus limosus TaxID=913252 RepID=A0A844GWM9_9RHOB|nr:hypothetical protein [Paracoccus limosus]